MQFNQKHVLVCPLNWGLGHATRCIPVIRELIKQGAEVMIGGDGDSLELLRKEFPMLIFHSLRAKPIFYSSNGNMIVQMLRSLPRLLKNIFDEHQQIKKLASGFKIDMVISDNRYGCWSKDCYSVFITHQLNIQCPPELKWLQPLLNRINHFFIRKYNECWVPDVKELPGLSGILSHGDFYLPEVNYVGVLSRFENSDAIQSINSRHAELVSASPEETLKQIQGDERIFDLLVILSGPEPQRTLFERMIIEQVSKTSLQTLIVRGKPKEMSVPEVASNISIVNHLETSLLKFHLQNAATILCRPGYSTIMDLAVLGRKAIVVPTPGQTEQEYLAGFYHLQKKHFMQLKSQFDLSLALKGIEYCNAFQYEHQEKLLEENISRILKNI